MLLMLMESIRGGSDTQQEVTTDHFLLADVLVTLIPAVDSSAVSVSVVSRSMLVCEE